MRLLFRLCSVVVMVWEEVVLGIYVLPSLVCLIRVGVSCITGVVIVRVLLCLVQRLFLVVDAGTMYF